jgi:hypothetical protein
LARGKRKEEGRQNNGKLFKTVYYSTLIQGPLHIWTEHSNCQI